MNATPEVSEGQAIISTLSPGMRRALLSTQPYRPEPEWDTVQDYCQGHESLRGDSMGVTVYCEGPAVCDQARQDYDTDRQEDPDRLMIKVGRDVTVGTIVALLGRGLVHRQFGVERQHELTDRGMATLHALKALQERGQAGTESGNRRAAQLARKLSDSASVHHLRAHTVSTVLTLLVREGAVTGPQAQLLNAVALEIDREVAGR